MNKCLKQPIILELLPLTMNSADIESPDNHYQIKFLLFICKIIKRGTMSNHGYINI